MSRSTSTDKIRPLVTDRITLEMPPALYVCRAIAVNEGEFVIAKKRALRFYKNKEYREIAMMKYCSITNQWGPFGTEYSADNDQYGSYSFLSMDKSRNLLFLFEKRITVPIQCLVLISQPINGRHSTENVNMRMRFGTNGAPQQYSQMEIVISSRVIRLKLRN